MLNSCGDDDAMMRRNHDGHGCEMALFFADAAAAAIDWKASPSQKQVGNYTLRAAGSLNSACLVAKAETLQEPKPSQGLFSSATLEQPFLTRFRHVER
jgi:hypothetical protein